MMQDYVGFTYNGKHSSELGIVRVSNGNRYEESLLPTMQDKTAQVSGGDGTYYFGSYYTQRQFKVDFAFDSLTEEQFQELKRHFGDKKIHELIFDELPYKIWNAKVTGSSTMKYLAFAEGATNRVYKGEGSITFTAYTPYAVCRHKWLNDSYYNDFKNKDEWRYGAGLKETSQVSGTNFNYDQINPNTEPNNVIYLYNPGDIESHFNFFCNFSYLNNGQTILAPIPAGFIEIVRTGDVQRKLSWKEIARQGNDTKICFNSRLNLIEGYDNNGKTGTIYNKDIIEGAFFKIPQEGCILQFSSDLIKHLEGNPIEYNYYYF